MDELVERLSTGTHPVEIVVRADPEVDLLKESLARKYVHIKFTATRGGTELGVELDPAASRWTDEQVASRSGTIHLDGTLTLNFEPVRCTADIDLSELRGTGRLIPLGASA